MDIELKEVVDSEPLVHPVADTDIAGVTVAMREIDG